MIDEAWHAAHATIGAHRAVHAAGNQALRIVKELSRASSRAHTFLLLSINNRSKRSQHTLCINSTDIGRIKRHVASTDIKLPMSYVVFFRKLRRKLTEAHVIGMAGVALDRECAPPIARDQHSVIGHTL